MRSSAQPGFRCVTSAGRVGLGEGEGDGLGDGLSEGEGLGVGVGDGVGSGAGVVARLAGLRVGLRVGLGVGLGEGPAGGPQPPNVQPLTSTRTAAIDDTIPRCRWIPLITSPTVGPIGAVVGDLSRR